MLTEHDKMLLDAFRMARDQAYENIGLKEENGQYVIRDALAFGEIAVLWTAPIPRNAYKESAAWAASQRMLEDIRDLRAVKLVVAAHTQFMLGKS